MRRYSSGSMDDRGTSEGRGDPPDKKG